MEHPHLSVGKLYIRMDVRRTIPWLAWALWIATPSPGVACTSLLVTRGASADGSVMITYTCDAAGAYARLQILAAADHKPGTMIEVRPGRQIPQASHTYKVLGVEGLGLMNEHQVVMAETTFGGRKELVNPKGLLDYPQLDDPGASAQPNRPGSYPGDDPAGGRTRLSRRRRIDLDRRSSRGLGAGDRWSWSRRQGGRLGGREGSRGPHLLPCEPGPHRRVPRNAPDQVLFSDNVESFAVSKGWYDPKSGQPFRFYEAYCPPTPASRRYCDMRVWSVLRRAAPSKNFSSDYLHNKPGSQPYPFSVVPDTKLTTAAVFALMRDQYEGTEFDMTKGIDAGPYSLPRRWRPLDWKVDGVEYGWMRPISTQQTGFSFVSQSRARLPNPVGGLLWYGVDDTYTSCYVPLYAGIDEVPKSFAAGSISRFSWDSAWWVFNFVSNYAYLKWSYMAPEIRAVQKDIETHFLALQPAVEKTAEELAKTDQNLMIRYLTDYSVMHAEQTVTRWRALGEHLLTKYNDGYVRDEKGQYPNVGYPEAWLRRVLKEKADQYRLPAEKPAAGAKPSR